MSFQYLYTFLNEVNDIVNKENIKRLLFENETISLAQYNSYAKKLNNTEFVELNHDFMLMRNKKEAFEIELMKKANNIAEKSFFEREFEPFQCIVSQQYGNCCRFL